MNVSHISIRYGSKTALINKFKIPLLLVLFLLSSYASADHYHTGPAFSDHKHIESMPNKWLTQPIKYKNNSQDVDLAITLDQHLYPALKPLINRYAQQNNLKITLENGTCGISAGALLDKKVDIGGFCCPPGETDRLPELTYHTLGIAALALITHPDNPVTGISFKQAQEIYRGKIGSWEDLTPDFSKQIFPVARLHCKNRPGHWRLLLDNEDMFSPALNEVGTIADIVRIAGTKDNSLGYETLWMARLHAGNNKVKILEIDAIRPDDNKSLIAARYPFYRTYNITTWNAKHLRKPHADKLVAYIFKHFNEVDPKFGLISSDKLRAAGWKFSNNELIAPPSSKQKRRAYENK